MAEAVVLAALESNYLKRRAARGILTSFGRDSGLPTLVSPVWLDCSSNFGDAASGVSPGTVVVMASSSLACIFKLPYCGGCEPVFREVISAWSAKLLHNKAKAIIFLPAPDALHRSAVIINQLVSVD